VQKSGGAHAVALKETSNPAELPERLPAGLVLGAISGLRRSCVPILVCCLLHLLLAPAPPQTAAAEETGKEMTLADCISAALDANRDIAGARQALEQAASGIAEARSGFLPNLSLSGSYNFMEKSQKIDFPLPGGEVEETEMDFTRDYGLEFLLSQALYTGGALSGSYRISKLGRDIAAADVERLEADVALSVIQVFYSYLLARESVSVAEEAIRTAEEFLRVVRARYDAGEASSFEVMRAEVEVSNLQPALIGARNAVALAELGLRNVMGMSLDSEVAFGGSFDETLGDAADPDLAGAIEASLERRPELRMLRAEADIAEQSLAVAKAGRLPTFALSATYDLMSDELSFGGDEWDKTYAGYLVMSLPIFDGLKTKSRIAGSRAQIKQAVIAVAGLRDGIELEVRSSLLGVGAAREQLKSQEKSVEMAAEGLRIANERYVQGLATNLEVMDAQLALTRARNYRLQALHDLNLASATLARATGALLERYRPAGRRD
jgi:outer membrane protein